METIFCFSSLISVAAFCLNRICNENPAETERNVSTLLLCSNDFATVLLLQRFRNGTEMVHLQRNTFETVQKRSTCNETIVCNG
jgi:hypothetical protein